MAMEAQKIIADLQRQIEKDLLVAKNEIRESSFNEGKRAAMTALENGLAMLEKITPLAEGSPEFAEAVQVRGWTVTPEKARQFLAENHRIAAVVLRGLANPQSINPSDLPQGVTPAILRIVSRAAKIAAKFEGARGLVLDELLARDSPRANNSSAEEKSKGT